jgi:catechol 2,3-dioxygenase-like lactoylglutathione lyase family enzyme
VSAIRPQSLDHVAIWVEDREALAGLLCDHLGMHVITEGEDFTLVGIDARQGKLTLFDAEGPREPGALERIMLRVGDLDDAVRRLPDGLGVERRDGIVELEAPDGLRLGLVGGNGLDYDLDHVVLRVPDPERTGRWLSELGFERRDGRLEVGGRAVRLVRGGAGVEPERPLLNHLAVLVDSAESSREEAERRGFEIAKVVDAENTLAAFVRGPDGIQVELVEHKPGFSLV